MKLFIKAILIWSATALTALASPVVIDGNTIEIGDTTYRVFGIDAPEYEQKCGKAQCGKGANGQMGSFRLSDTGLII